MFIARINSALIVPSTLTVDCSVLSFATRNIGVNYCKHATTLDSSRKKRRFYSTRVVETLGKNTREKMRENYAKMLEKYKCEYKK